MRSRPVSVWPLLLAALLIPIAGCEDSSPSKPAPDTVTFGDLTEKEHIIINLELSYEELNFDQFSRLLLSEGDTYNGSTYANGYYWYNQPGTVGSEEYIPLSDELARTYNMFRAAQGDPVKDNHPVIYRLTLSLTDGAWTPVEELWSEPCEDCWYTERGYELFLDLEWTDVQALDNVQLYIVPVDEGGTKIYKIAVARDVTTL